MLTTHPIYETFLIRAKNLKEDDRKNSTDFSNSPDDSRGYIRTNKKYFQYCGSISE
jgi:hypothetical protein